MYPKEERGNNRNIKFAPEFPDKKENKQGVDQMKENILSALKEFKAESGNLLRPSNLFMTYIMIFPDISATLAPTTIDRVQTELKSLFVESFLMLGEFHPLNNSEGLRNPNFRPLRSPIPLLVIRHMMPTDIVFLAWDKYPSEFQRNLVISFLKRFEGTHSDEYKVALQKLEEIENNLKEESMKYS